MEYSNTIVGLDVSKEVIATAVLPPGTNRPTEIRKVLYHPAHVDKFVRRVGMNGPATFVYEAGPFGYELQRQITALGHQCAVIAPALIPKRPGDRVKTDRRDAENLARLYRAGELTAIRIPTREEEAARDLLRTREDCLADRLRAQHRLIKFLLRQGRVFREASSWTLAHRAWLRSQRFDHQSSQQTHQAYLRALEEAEARLESLSRQVLDMSEREAYQVPVRYLRCLKGIDVLSAMTLVTEFQDMRRFSKARGVMGYTGMVPSEFTTAFNPRRGRITKTGNAHVRRILVEASWCCRSKSILSATLAQRRKACPPEIVRIAKKAEDRLHRKFWRLVSKGKPANKAVVAVARELAGFVWAIGQHFPQAANA